MHQPTQQNERLIGQGVFARKALYLPKSEGTHPFILSKSNLIDAMKYVKPIFNIQNAELQQGGQRAVLLASVRTTAIMKIEKRINEKALVGNEGRGALQQNRPIA